MQNLAAQIETRAVPVEPFASGIGSRDGDADQGGDSGFATELAATLQRLSAARLRISLARLTISGDGSTASMTASQIAAAVDGGCNLAGTLSDGSVIAAFIGPRVPGDAGDELVTTHIVRRFCEALRDAGLGVNLERHGRLAVMHRWADEIVDLPSLTLDLARTRQASLRPALLVA